jgi:hypothetical protein
MPHLPPLTLTLRQIVADAPLDAGAWVTYAVLALFVGFVWIGNRGSGGRGSYPAS